MKLSLLIISLLFATTAFSQGRSCDIRANITSPTDGHIFVTRSSQEVQVSLINEGPDTLRHGDDYSVKFIFGSFHLHPKFGSINRYIYPGDSFVFTDTLDINYVGNVDSMPFCTEVVFYNIGRDSLKLETGSQLDNNKHCITGKHKGPNMSFKQDYKLTLSLTIYPNPATNDVHIKSPNVIKTIVVTDQKGSVVRNLESVDKLDTIVDVKDLTQGVYFITINTESHAYTEKLIRIP